MRTKLQGVSGCFRKPFDAQVMLAAIGNVLRKSKNGDEHES